MKVRSRQLSTVAEVVAMVEAARHRGETVVFSNGVFDLLHPGHVRYLEKARRLGDLLIVAINSDRSVKAIKGPSRPLTPARERGEVLLALQSVDAVLTFDETTPHRVITAIQPDVLVKGADWDENEIVGREVVAQRGGRVVRIELAAGYSTTELIQRVKLLPRRS